MVTSFAHSMCGTSMAFSPMLHSHAHIEEIKANINSTANRHSDEHSDSDEHSEVANEATNVKDLNKEVATHDDEAAPINEHDFEDSLR